MDTKLKDAVDVLYGQLNELEEKKKNIMRTINDLSVINGEEKPFSEIDSNISSTGSSIRIEPDTFYSENVNGMVKKYLKMKGKAATAKEILDALERGGFVFPKQWTDKLRLKNLAIMIRKNSTEFAYIVSNKSFGLWEFYPDMKKQRDKDKANKAMQSEAGTTEPDDLTEEDLAEIENGQS